MTTALQTPFKTSLLGLCPIDVVVEELAGTGQGERGAIVTGLKIVRFVLGIVSRTTDQPLASLGISEPSSSFLAPLVSRTRALRV